MKTPFPKVYVLARSKVDFDQTEDFLSNINFPEWRSDAANDAALIPEISGRVCYMSFKKSRPGGNKSYINHILDVGHFSVIEHVSWTLAITGVSRSLTHELVRHRAGTSYSQQSQRYVDESESEVIVPEIIKEDEKLYSKFKQSVAISQTIYKELVEGLEAKLTPAGGASFEEKTNIRKTARQAARSVLPNATQTRLVWTVNARAARHFLLLRASKFADFEIRRLANVIFEVLIKEAPELFNDFKLIPLEDGTFELTTENHEV